MSQEDQALKVPEVAKRLRVSEETVRRWLRDGGLRGVRFSDRGGWRVLSSEVERKLRGETSQGQGDLGKAKAALPVKQAPPSLPTPWLQHGAGAAL